MSNTKQTFPQTMKLEVSAEGRLQYDPHAATRAYQDMWGAGISVHEWVYVEERGARLETCETTSEISVWVSNRMRDDIERAIMVLGLKGDYL